MAENSKPRVLLLMLEFPQWKLARAWGYTTHFGIEEGLLENGVECVTIPVFNQIPASSPMSWLKHLRSMLADESFDQVWVWVVHTEYNEEFWSALSELAPVRVGFIVESMTYTPEISQRNRNYAERAAFVESHLPYFTHTLVVDEVDVEHVRSKGFERALWWPSCIPRRYISNEITKAPNNLAAFPGSTYDIRIPWLQREDVKGLVGIPKPPAGEEELAKKFNEVNASAVQFLKHAAPRDTHYLLNHVGMLRQVRRAIFTNWVESLKQWRTVLNLPSHSRVYTSRVIEAMAAGRPVVAWRVPDRPLTEALYRDGEEIFLYDEMQPERFAESIQRLREDESLAWAVATAAQKNILENHTTEKRIADVLRWIETGDEPRYF